jgi:hypothetical protein
MQPSLIRTNNLSEYSTKEAGPIVIAFAFVIAMGGMVAAAIIVCGWRGAKSMGINWVHRKVEIVCR